ncbi:MAG TPA: FHA domain-containing protein [Rhodocyclaceae bacterium]|nr:FHA domain-containing protein [Rhodocyclaceae bacterium]
MSERKNLCVLVAEVVGGPKPDASLDMLEARHAFDRCMRRIDLAIEANQGSTIRHGSQSVSARFERSDEAVLAACEILERIQSLPPLRGKRLTARIGIHHGALDLGSSAQGEGEEVASRLCIAARGGEALATGAAVMLLSAATRHFARAQDGERAGLETLEWPLFAVSRQAEAVVSLPPAARLLQRMRLRHQEDVLFLDEQHPILLFGRELGNDVVIMDPRASRQHARIERRRGGFVLIDYSTNGCYVVEDSGSERCIKGSEVPLVGPGRIGCGFSANEVERDLVFFEIL